MEEVSTNMVSNFLTRIPPLFSDLAKLIAGDIDCSQTVLASHSTDGSPYIIAPQAVIYPKNATDIKHVLSFVREYTMPLTVRGSGEGTQGGALGEGIILDMTRYFNHTRNVNMMEHTVTVDAGTTIGELRDRLHGWNFDIPVFIGVEPSTTIGALVSTKSSSGSSFHHGSIREWIEGLTIVVDNGEEHTIADGITPSGRLLGIYQSVFPLLTKEAPLARAAKPKCHDDATGYNIWNTSIGPRQLIDQLTGSEGTLGIITSITLRLTPYKKHTHTTCIPAANKELLATYIAIAKHHASEHMFLYDETFMQLSDRYHTTVVPFFKDTPYVLLVTHTAHDAETLHNTVRKFTHALPLPENELQSLHDVRHLERIVHRDFLMSLYSIYTKDTLLPVTVADGLIVEVHKLPLFLEALEDYLYSTGKLYTITGNIGSGHVSVTTLFDPLSKLYDNEMLTYTKNIFALVKEYQGGISTQGGEGLAKTAFLSTLYSEQTLGLFKKIKTLWDPLNILNPSKKIYVSTRYLQQHQKRVVS